MSVGQSPPPLKAELHEKVRRIEQRAERAQIDVDADAGLIELAELEWATAAACEAQSPNHRGDPRELAVTAKHTHRGRPYDASMLSATRRSMGAYPGAHSLYCKASRIEDLPLTPWPNWLGGPTLRFVGGDGRLGIATEDRIDLRLASHSILHDVERALAN